ncbi:MAG: hypothetical protein JW821_02445 [Deltaproteobacteria bacterium]|nr:hypothetical protein [Deltaproteobacteria bacterium]
MEPEMSIQSLLDKIRREGIEAAGREAEKVLEQAHSEAESILKKAREEAEDRLKQAEEEMVRDRASFETAMAQAARNLVLGIKKEIVDLCRGILERKTSEALTPEGMREVILKVLDKWEIREGRAELEILLSEEDRRALEDRLLGALQEELKGGVVLKPTGNIRSGFRIGERDGGLHYDFTERGIAQLLSEYLGPRTARFLEEISGEQAGGQG